MGQLHLFFGTPQQAAILAAQSGNWKPADDMELAFLNDPANGIEPHYGEDEGDHQDICVGEAKAYALHRHDDGLHVLWALAADGVSDLKPCDHLADDGETAVPEHCEICHGSGYRVEREEDEQAPAVPTGGVITVETDIDGLIHAVRGR
jgi:hypothetical protein